jgi:hypothetical protein
MWAANLAGMFSRQLLSVLAAYAVCLSASALAQSPSHTIQPNGTARPPNADGYYQALRGASPTGEGIQVKDFTLARQGGNFHFTQGSFYFYAPVDGKVTGAVFLGNGHFDLTPKDASERHSLSLLNKSGVMAQDFTTLVLRFTDGTDAEVRKASSGVGGPTPAAAGSAATELAHGLRNKLHDNFDLRILNDVLTPEADANNNQYFLASFRMGGTFTGRNVLFVVDPEESPDEVELSTWNDEGSQTWVGYRMQDARGATGQPIRITTERLDVSFEKSGTLHGSAETTFHVERGGMRVVQLDLYPTLRVSGVFSETGAPLDFVQEDKHDDPQFAVILPTAATSGSTVRVLTQYSGPDAIRHDGDGMYYLMSGARDSWYPAGGGSLGNFTDFHMTFHLPKGLQIVATGKQVSQEKEPGGGQKVVWDSGEPIAVAGFNLGNFVADSTKTPSGFDVQAYANVDVPDDVKPMLIYLDDHPGVHVALGNLSTIPALKGEVAQGSAAIQVYTDFFGKLPYDHVALTEQGACNYGQSWPMLVYLPYCGFWDSTIQEQLGLLGQNRSYWQNVTAHEVAHQWWGQLVGFSNYRDQWMSEGFADFSVSLYLAATNKTLNEFREFWEEQHKNLVSKNAQGVRPIDVGALTMGYRVANEKTGNIYQDLIYSKGAYVMHMLQVMYWTPEQGDAPFKRSMQTFVKEYSGKPATTEDLKASFERTMPKWLDLQGNGKLDWFFNEYIYGTELPHYDISSDFTTADGESSVHLKVTQANVSKDFLMMVPVYLQLADGRTVRLLNLSMKGDMTFDRTLKIGKLPAAPKKMLLNYNADVLSD